MSRDLLRELMNPEHSAVEQWSAEDMRAMLEHLLATPLSREVDAFAECTRRSRDEVLEVIAGKENATFLQVLTGENSAEVLGLLKSYAKGVTDLPREVARVLYVATLASAAQAGVSITTLSAENIEREVLRGLTILWLPEAVRRILKLGITHGK